MDEPVDYDDDAEIQQQVPDSSNPARAGHHANINVSSFKDFMLKPEITRAVADCGFEHPSQVQHESIPQALLGTDVLCQAKSGMGKTAVFVLSTVQQLTPVPGQVHVVVLAHCRELALQIQLEYNRFTKYLPDIKSHVFFGGNRVQLDEEYLRTEVPTIVVGTPGRIKDLVERKALDLSHVKHFVLDECDRLLREVDMRRQVQAIFKSTPHDKQVMMFSATLGKDIRPVCKKFCQEPLEIYVDDESKLSLHGLQQYIVRLKENEKNRKLIDILDALNFNQVVIFVSQARRADELSNLLKRANFPAICIHARMNQPERLARFQAFKDFQARVLVATDLFGRGIDIEKVNIVINYDFPEGEDSSDQYLHRVARAGRFGTKGLAISFLASEEDNSRMSAVQSRFAVEVPELPEALNVTF